MAQKKITELPLATGVTGTNVLPVVVNTTTSRVTLATLSSFFASAGPTGATGPAGSAGSEGPTGATGAAGAGEAYQQATAPASASAGATWLDTDTGQFFTRYDGVWIEVGGKHYP